MKELTPREIVRELNRYIIGQDDAKRAVAIALRNRYRRAQLPEELRNEISPKNILMIGPTGVGKTEIARRLAKLVDAPFVKVEATKFTEVGYVGRDVESIIRDLMENAIRLVRDEFKKKVEVRAQVLAEDRLVTLLVSPPKKSSGNPFEMLLGNKKEPDVAPEEQVKLSGQREEIRQQLQKGLLEDRELEIEVEESTPQLEVGGSSINIGDMMGGMLPKKTKIRRVKVKDARKILFEEEASKLIDDDDVQQEAINRVEQHGIVFIDEIDKVAGRSSGHGGPDVSREGVQRDILPIVEGSTVNTKYGAVKTDFILFIAAGAFHVAKVTDLIPELQGRFPVHVTLKSLSQEDFKLILTQPDNALTRQYEALLGVDKVKLMFDEKAIAAIARAAYVINENKEDIGARRLLAVFEKLLEDVSYHAGGDDMPEVNLNITEEYVMEHLAKDETTFDTRRFIL
ncbi:MAG TPA: ATP-dependent protease ATPase subunit HslU [Candidatus Limiplasma sp.]|nr:ATP-dependent protease ATPase subunit HslU [Candidatus Limiplasma sp.]HRX08972.1 ATP-dependent protease ATPase subunit HslU [Candidatus Limiplasma sp.]